MVSITPNSYLYNKSAIKLRKYLLENKFIEEIIDYNSEKIFDNVSTYCCITIFSKKNKKSLTYNKKNILYENIKNNEYNIFNINKNDNVKTLDDICTIRNGINNGPKESWCIFPYDNNGNVLNEDNLKNDNPKTYNYLTKHKEELSKRDNGNKVYPKWYSYGRTQSLKLSTKDNIMYIPVFSEPENINYIKKKPMLFYNCLSLEIKDDNYKLEDIKKILIKNKKLYQIFYMEY